MAHPKNQVLIVCEYCGKEFSVKKSFQNSYRYCGFECRTKAKTIKTNCLYCDKEFTTYKKNKAKYCSISCGISARNKTSQNPCYSRDITGDKNPMFGKGQSGSDNGMYGRTKESNPAWNGGRKIRKDGYILVIAPEEHPNKADGIYILEHRIVMENKIGRYLEPSEVVHHIDGNPSNNNIENLELFSSQSEHIAKAHAIHHTQP
jgi:hypothetical protein